MNFNPLLSIMFIFLLLAKTEGYADNRYFRHYNNKHGLSHNTVYASIQDKRGFMWFGTEDGLNRFDGHVFKIYRYNSSTNNCIPNDFIISLFQDSKDRIWICTNRGVCFYDYDTDTFYPFWLNTEQEQVEYFRQIREDAQNNLWFICHERIVRYSLTDETYNVYPGNEYFHPNTITITDEGNPLFSDGYALYEYNKQTDSFSKTQILTPDEIKNQTHIEVICQVPDAGILIGTNKKGLMFFNYRLQKMENIIPDIQIRDICLFNKHTYWIASESGIYIYNILDKSVVNLRKSLTNEYALADNAVYSLTKDREGGMWAGSFFGGISYLPKQYTPFDYFIGGKTHAEMPGNAIREICPDQYGMIWLGTEDNGINKYNPKTGEITNYSYNNPKRPLSATNIHGLLALGDKLWVGTYNKGIDVMDIPSGKIVKRYTRENTAQGLNSDFIVCFYATRSDELFVGTSIGVSLFDKQTDGFRQWKNIRSLVRQIYEDREGNLWFITSHGAYRYLRKMDELRHYTYDPSDSQSIGDNNTTSVFEDSKGRIWLSSVNGLALFNKETETFNRLTTEDGLPSSIVYRIVEDESGYFWLSTANGLVRFHPETQAMRVFTYTDGLHETQFNYSSSYKAPDGTIYMGTISGMIAFNPKRFKEDDYVPPVFITRLNVPDSKSNKYKSLPAESIESIETLKLPYDAATFSLSFVALSYTSPEAIRYAYQLEPIDKDWIYMNDNKEVTFANLSPGKYVFKVKSTNSSGRWEDNEYTLPILITPPFWLTGWAFFVYSVLAASLVFFFYNYKKRRLEEKHRLNRERFEARKEKELYDAKIQFFTFITHEIRTPLTLIKAPLEKIIRSGDGTAETKENLQTIERNTARLLNLSNQLLDFRKTESKGFKLNYVDTDIVVWTESILQSFLPVMKLKNKVFTAAMPEKLLTALIDREAFSKIISNLLSNAVKYADKAIHLSVKEDKANNTFSIAVISDGPVIPETERERLFAPFYRLNETIHQEGSGIGLALARSLADFHQGTLTCTQTKEGLNCFTLTLPAHQSQEKTDIFLPQTEKETEKSGKPVILIVEDQEEMRNFLYKELSNEYSVLEATDGKEALNRLATHTINLIISDVMMPNMDGFELCNAVKNDVNYSHIPFILLTAQHNLQSHLKGLNQGADAYMEKPFSIELVLAQVNNLLKNRELLNKAYKEKPLTQATDLSTSPADDIFLTNLTNCIERNITNQRLGVEMLAAELGMSTSGLYRKVKGISGIPPVEFIKIARLKKAVRLMQEGETRMNEIAFQSGFSSPSYFSTSFLKQYGKSPSEFIKK